MKIIRQKICIHVPIGETGLTTAAVLQTVNLTIINTRLDPAPEVLQIKKFWIQFYVKQAHLHRLDLW